MSNNSTIDLDFTMSFTIPPDTGKKVAEAEEHVVKAIALLEHVAETGVMSARAWRLLAALYLGDERESSLKELETKYQYNFGLPVFRDPEQEKAPVARCKVFVMPEKISPGTLPDVAAVRAACVEAPGARLDFRKVHSIGTGGLAELTTFFSQLPTGDQKPEMPGVERFVVSLEKAIEQDRASKESWDALFAYWRLLGRQDTFDDLAIQYAVKTGISPPSW